MDISKLHPLHPLLRLNKRLMMVRKHNNIAVFPVSYKACSVAVRQSVSGVCVVYRLIRLSRRRISIHSILSQFYMADQYCPVHLLSLPADTGRPVQLVECIKRARHDNLPVSPAWLAGCSQSAIETTTKSELTINPQQPCLCLGCQNPGTIQIAIFKHNNKVYQSYRNLLVM